MKIEARYPHCVHCRLHYQDPSTTHATPCPRPNCDAHGPVELIMDGRTTK